MISLTLSEAFGYDLFAIASIKACHNPANDAAQSAAESLSAELARQVGRDLHYSVLGSAEFKRLREVNDEMYVRIDELKERAATGEDALYIDNRVYQRYLAKQALQQRWFPDQPMTEVKYGYKGMEGQS
jgi:hypothetical protein